MNLQLKELLEQVGELHNVLMADLETGSHGMNNAAARHFNREYPMLMAHINKLVQLAQRIEEGVTP